MHIESFENIKISKLKLWNTFKLENIFVFHVIFNDYTLLSTLNGFKFDGIIIVGRTIGNQKRRNLGNLFV